MTYGKTIEGEATMQVGFMSSSEAKKCTVCGRKTADYKVYEQSDISIVIPVCDRTDRRCTDLVSVEEAANIAIRLIKKEIKQRG